jgi:hypothetical protein
MSEYLSTIEEVTAAAVAFADSESEVENERGQVDWDRTFDRIEAWHNLSLPSDTDDERYRIIRREITKARRAG